MPFYRINSEKIVADKFDNETIIVNLSNGNYYSLRGSATDIWNLLEVGLKTEEVSSYYSVLSDEELNQVSNLIKKLSDEDLAIRVEEGSVARLEDELMFSTISFEKYEDMQELILLDPIHEVDAKGWPQEKKDSDSK